MPELPEVQTVINGLQNTVIGKEIVSIKELRAGTIVNHTEIADLGVISKINRRGKYIIISTSNNFKIVIHLRMTGKLIYENDYNIITDHTRAEIVFSDRTKLNFNDVRTFGKIEIYNNEENVKALDLLGVEPLSEKFNISYLIEQFDKRKAPVKNVLLDQKVIAGLGNIYVNEILFHAGIDPTTPVFKLKKNQIRLIISETKKVLKEALKYNGTTISDYRNIDDKSGEFQKFLKVYGKTQCQCATDLIRIKQAGRSTFYCPQCQH